MSNPMHFQRDIERFMTAGSGRSGRRPGLLPIEPTGSRPAGFSIRPGSAGPKDRTELRKIATPSAGRAPGQETEEGTRP